MKLGERAFLPKLQPTVLSALLSSILSVFGMTSVLVCTCRAEQVDFHLHRP